MSAMTDHLPLPSPSSDPARRELLLKELEYRRDKLWKIFSWCSTILTAVTTGFVAIKASSQDAFAMTPPLAIVLTVVILALAAHAVAWIRYNLLREAEVRRELEVPQRIEPRFGYNVALLILMAAAVAAVWINP